jgi:3-deoxy-manno-octulosonate cytidylyltransferase (CMP-KDO synthetase)
MPACLAVIPARWASSRLPGKPLADIGGKAMIQRVWEQAVKAKPERLLVATDDARIRKAVEAFGGEALMTDPDCPSGTDRCAEVAQRLDWPEDGVVINVQGDEPFLDPGVLQALHGAFSDPAVRIATIAIPLADPAAFANPNTPKVVLDRNGDALYFSRCPIPHGAAPIPEQDADASPVATPAETPAASGSPAGSPSSRGLPSGLHPGGHIGPWRHIGVYAYRRSTLDQLAALPPSPLEQAERLEQLRWLEHGWRIRVLAWNRAGITVDTPEDLEAARRLAQQGQA